MNYKNKIIVFFLVNAIFLPNLFGQINLNKAYIDSLIYNVNNNNIHYVTIPKNSNALMTERRVVIDFPRSAEILSSYSYEIVDDLMPYLLDDERGWAIYLILCSIDTSYDALILEKLKGENWNRFGRLSAINYWLKYKKFHILEGDLSTTSSIEDVVDIFKERYLIMNRLLILTYNKTDSRGILDFYLSNYKDCINQLIFHLVKERKITETTFEYLNRVTLNLQLFDKLLIQNFNTNLPLEEKYTFQSLIIYSQINTKIYYRLNYLLLKRKIKKDLLIYTIN